MGSIIIKKSPCLEGLWIVQNRGLTSSLPGTTLPSLEYKTPKWALF
jgi:hypothetical protein